MSDLGELLMNMCENGALGLEGVKLLVEHGADVNIMIIMVIMHGYKCMIIESSV